MKYLAILAILAALLTSCGGTDLKTVELEPLLVQSGDLPAGFSGAQFKETPPSMFDTVPKPTKALYQSFERSGGISGGVTVLLYDSLADRDSAYVITNQGMGDGTQAQADIGEKASVNNASALLTFIDLAFVRCHAMAHIRLVGTKELSDATAYAKRLDKRLQSIVC